MEDQLKQLCKDNGEIEIEFIDLSNKAVVVMLPYETSSVVINLEGDTDEGLVESFKRGVNQRLEDMCNHLNECKL